ncbi:Pantothenate kinase [Mycena chlorophos]|uniref:Pantothenate kinase n=1 Tax=Mycena chlorophos TaxID=658473 RepID=A0A8H6SMX6_MYCCL|nr:Pantothenate kinase [Mycena chlorophos]
MADLQQQPKKPRHRHSAVQLAALNALYEKTEHPTLTQRTELALSLGFSVVDDAHFRSQAPLDHQQLGNQAQYNSPADPDLGHLSRAVVDELEAIRRRNPYPTFDESKMVAERLQVHHSTIIDWFRMHDDTRDHSLNLPPLVKTIPSLRLPPLSALPPASSTSHPSLAGIMEGGSRRLPSVHEEDHHSYASPGRQQRSPSPRDNAAPYSTGSSATTVTRPRRGRPDTMQLEGLRRLLAKTANPTIEERSALGREIGMDLVKVSNWFRNLRQSKAKRARRQMEQSHMQPGSEDESTHSSLSGDRVYLSSTSPSRSETPPPSATSYSSSVEAVPALTRSSSSSDDSEAQQRARSRAWMRRLVHSSDDEEEVQEAVTPPPPAPMPMQVDAPPPQNKAYEDAMLLLSFHQHAA